MSNQENEEKTKDKMRRRIVYPFSIFQFCIVSGLISQIRNEKLKTEKNTNNLLCDIVF